MPNYTTNKTLAQLDPVSLPTTSTDELLLGRANETFKTTLAAVRSWLFNGGLEGTLTATQNSDVAIVRRNEFALEVSLSNLLPALSVTAAKLASNAVTDTKLQSSTVTDADRAVGRDHIKTRSVGGEQLEYPVGTQESASNVAGRPIGARHIQDNAVLSRCIPSLTIENRHIAPSEIDSTKFDTYSGFAGHPLGDINRCVTHINAAPDGCAAHWSAPQVDGGGVAGAWDSLANTLGYVAERNRRIPSIARALSASPTFSGGSTVNSIFGGAFSGGVLLPDGRVFLVPFNYTAPMIYDPRTDLAVNVPPPENGVIPATGALFSGGVLISDFDAVPRYTYDLAAQVAVVCIPYNSKRALLYYPYENRSIWTNEIASLPSRAFIGGVSLPHFRKFSSHRAAFLSPCNSVHPGVVRIDGTLELITSLNKGTAPNRGAALTPSGNVVFGNRMYNATTGAMTNGPASGADTVTGSFAEPQPVSRASALLNARGEVLHAEIDWINANSVTVKAYTNSSFDLIRTVTSIPFSTVDDYSGMVRLPDGFVVLVPGRAQHPRIFDGDAENTNTSIQATGFPTPPTTQEGFGKGAFAGGVLLPDGRVFCVPCTSTKAMIITPRAACAPLGWDILLGPHYNKR